MSSVTVSSPNTELLTLLPTLPPPVQSSLFDPAPTPHPEQIGKTAVTYREARSILTKGAGFMAAYDYTLNPYSGCSFGCAYCYAAFFSRSKEKQDTWGDWVTVKENALALLRKKRPSTLRGKAVYMSSVTDPYQPIEKKLELTRGALRILADVQPQLVVQTRSPLVTRDLDLLKRFEDVQVNMTVTTDSEDVRRAFEPGCPNNRVRLRAIAEVQAAGVPACVTMTPLLPVEDADRFADRLLETGVERFIVQPFHASKGRFVAGTRDEALRVTRRYGWTRARYEEVADVLRTRLPNLGEGVEGFAPPSS